MTIQNLVLEIGAEELPSRFIPDALSFLEKSAREDFASSRITFKNLSVFATPRRIALVFRDVDDLQKDLVTSFRGPAWKTAFDANGSPTRAAQGFAKGRGVPVENLTPVESDGVKYACATVSEKCRPSVEILPDLFSSLIKKLTFPKSMYWDDSGVRFARPVRWILAMADGHTLTFPYGEITSGNITIGHRFMGAKQIVLSDAGNFIDRLYDNYVLLDQEKRRQKMLAAISALEKDIEGSVELDPEVISENLYLVEYPVPFFGTFDRKYLEIPEEVLTTSMKKNQKYFSVRGKNGRLLPFFVGVSNNLAANMEVVREGNERVLRARLDDAAFFWAEDRKGSLASKVEELKTILYQEKLGTLHAKVMATRELARSLCRAMNEEDVLPLVDRAALLAKADLVTAMVYEFPDLQGVMGREYALRGGEPERVARAIYEQYLPRSAGGAIPSDIVGAILGIAERTHIIVSIHKAGLEPSGSQDPYGLRRAARCINEILWGLSLDVDMADLVARSCEANSVNDELKEQILAFLSQRLLMQLKEKGYGHEMTLLAISVTGHRPLQVLRFLEVFSNIQGQQWFLDLVTAAVRVRNLLAREETVGDRPDPELFSKNAEGELFREIERVEPVVEKTLREKNWNALAESLSELSPFITTFFDDVLVMDPDSRVKENRIALLSLCSRLFLEVGDLGLLKGA